MPRKNSRIPRIQSRSLCQYLRLRNPAANRPVITQCLKKPAHGITPTDKNAAGCDKNTGRIRIGHHASLINGDAL